MDASAFFVELKRHAPVAPRESDPLAIAQCFIDRHGETGEGRVLLAIVKALWSRIGEFRQSDLYSLSSQSASLAAALVDARESGQYREWEWHRASCYPAWRFLLDLHKKYGIT